MEAILICQNSILVCVADPHNWQIRCFQPDPSRNCTDDCNKQEIGPFETIEIRVDVENVGSRAGDEVVQLYLRDLYASMARPVKELAGFKRITLEPGEKQTVIFEVKASQMAFLDMNMQWKVEKGTFLVEVGSSSQDIRLKDEYKVTEDGWLEGTDRGFYAKAYKEADRT